MQTFKDLLGMYNLYSSTESSSDEEDFEENYASTLDMSHMGLDSSRLHDNLKFICDSFKRKERQFKTILLFNNMIVYLSPRISNFNRLKYLDVSSNNMHLIPGDLCLCPLRTLIAKNNRLNSKSLPPEFATLTKLKELNLSGNEFTDFPPEILELKTVKFLYMGGNRITEIPKDIKKMESLQILSMGGNRLTMLPPTLGQLQNLSALVLSDNQLQCLPREIARLRNLKSLLLHKNQLKTLPTEIVALRCLTELSLRDNPLVGRFVSDIANAVPSLLELSARVIKLTSIPYSDKDLPGTLVDYLDSANQCVNPGCKGVYFDNRIEHVKFVDFCGKYRVPLMQYLCSSHCIDDDEDDVSVDYSMMRRVLLG